jgi:hypothetical protein
MLGEPPRTALASSDLDGYKVFGRLNDVKMRIEIMPACDRSCRPLGLHARARGDTPLEERQNSQRVMRAAKYLVEVEDHIGLVSSRTFPANIPTFALVTDVAVDQNDQRRSAVIRGGTGRSVGCPH